MRKKKEQIGYPKKSWWWDMKKKVENKRQN